MPVIINAITLETVKAAQPETVWYAVKTCWWTHRQTDLRTLPDGLPCDPRGSVLMMTDGQGVHFPIIQTRTGYQTSCSHTLRVSTDTPS